MKQKRPKRPNIEGTMQWVDSVFATPEGFSSGRWFQMMWPWMLLAGIAGIAFIFLQLAVFGLRRRIYNHNRNRKYTLAKEAMDKEVTGKQKWRKKPRVRYKIVLPLPPHFTENLCRQWDKVHDSLDEMLKFGDMLIELDDYVDNSLVFNKEGNISGSRPGIRGFLLENCPHIGYKTAMRYRILAMKAKISAREQKKFQKIRKESMTIYDLGKNLDSHLEVEHQCLEYQPREPHQCNRKDIFVMREQALSAIRQLDNYERQRYATALHDLARDISVS